MSQRKIKTKRRATSTTYTSQVPPIQPMEKFVNAVFDAGRASRANVMPIEFGVPFSFGGKEYRLSDDAQTNLMVQRFLEHFEDDQEQFGVAFIRFRALLHAKLTFSIDRQWWENSDNWKAAVFAATVLPVEDGTGYFRKAQFWDAMTNLARPVPRA